MVLLPGKRIWFVELKRPGEKARGQQQLRHQELAARGFPVVVLDSKKQVIEFMEGVAGAIQTP
jgi:hypothetical protein